MTIQNWIKTDKVGCFY